MQVEVVDTQAAAVPADASGTESLPLPTAAEDDYSAIYGDDYNPVADPIHINQINATILHCLGVEHDRFTFRYQGLDQRLTGVEPMSVIRRILA